MTNVKIGSTIKMLREEAGLTQTQIASFLGVDQSYISKCEKGERPFTVDALEKLCDLFGCVLSDLVNADTSQQPLSFAFRADKIETDDLNAIAEINRVALNLAQMKKLLEAV